MIISNRYPTEIAARKQIKINNDLLIRKRCLMRQHPLKSTVLQNLLQSTNTSVHPC